MVGLSDSNNIDIQIRTEANTEGITKTERALHGMGVESESSGLSFGRMAGAVAAGQAVFNLASEAIRGIAGFLKESVTAAGDNEKSIAQMNAALKSTSNASGMSADELIKLSRAMQAHSTYSHEAVLSTEDLLLTFENIGKNTFPQATQAVLDMSTAMHQDLKTTAIQVGKALQDPVKGATSLRRVGVMLTDQQKEMIKTLVATGQSAKAQQIIIKELGVEFGGSAKAAGETFAGSMEKLKNNMNDVKESLGQAIIKGITPFTQKAAEFLSAVDWDKVLKTTTNAVKSMWKEIVSLYDSCKKVFDVIEDYLQPKFEALWHTIEEKLMPQLEKLWKNVIEPLLPVLGGLLVGAIGFAVDAINFLVDATVKVAGWMEKHKGIVMILAGAFGSLAAAMGLGAAFDAITVGFATMQLVTIPSLMATFSTLGSAFMAAFPIALVITGILLIGVEIAKIFDAYKKLQGLNEEASKGIKTLNKQMDDSIAKGKLTLDQAYKIQNGAGYTGDKTVFNNNNTYLTGYASGTASAAPGPHLVGENGPEIVNFKGGETVKDATETKKAIGGGTTFNQTNHIYNTIDMEEANREIGWRLANA